MFDFVDSVGRGHQLRYLQCVCVCESMCFDVSLCADETIGRVLVLHLFLKL